MNLLQLVLNNDVEAIRHIINEVDVNLCDNYSRYPLIIAARRGYFEIAEILLDAGANTDVKMNDKSAIEWAAGEGYLDIVTLLLSRGSYENGALYEAFSNGYLEMAKLFIKHGEIDDKEINKCTIFAVRNNHPEIFEILTDNNIIINGQPSLYENLVNQAIVSKNYDLAIMLIKMGCPVNIPDNIIRTSPLANAISNNQTDLAELLLNYGANPFEESPNINSFSVAMEKDNLTILRKIFMENRLPKQSFILDIFDYSSPFNIEILQSLLEFGLDVNMVYPDDGKTLLHMAAIGNKIEMVNFLLANGAIIKPDNIGSLPQDLTSDDDIKHILNTSQGIRKD